MRKLPNTVEKGEWEAPEELAVCLNPFFYALILNRWQRRAGRAPQWPIVTRSFVTWARGTARRGLGRTSHRVATYSLLPAVNFDLSSVSGLFPYAVAARLAF